jgi:flagellar M-ring protein FliF
MANSLNVVFSQIREIWKHFGLNQKISTVMALLLTVALIAGLLVWSGRPDYRLLYSGLSLKDAATIREKLEESRIPLRIRSGGTAVYVPSKEVYRARLMLASEGLPKDSAAGFELFEQPKFGLTDFAQKVNYQRALQGELERTIAEMNGIEAARVMLVLPKDKLFAKEEDKKSSASIMLTLGNGSISPVQVNSITHMVASSVEGLDPNCITVTDQQGRLLSTSTGSTPEEILQTSDQLAAQEKMERMLTRKAQDMLDHALGLGKSIVRVNVALDFSKIEKRNETYDSENRVVRSESIESESSTSPGPNGGNVAGVVANIPVGTPTQASVDGDMSKSKKENIRTEYAIPSGVELIQERGARIRQLSVSVCVAQQGEQPRTADALGKIGNMVKNAVGFVQNDVRTDTIDVTEMAFPEVAPTAPLPWWEKLPVRIDVIGRGLLAAFLLLAVYLVSRRLMSGLVIQREEVGVPVGSLRGETAAEVAGMAPAAVHREIEPSIDENLNEVSQIAETNPRAIAAWISSVVASDTP